MILGEGSFVRRGEVRLAVGKGRELEVALRGQGTGTPLLQSSQFSLEAMEKLCLEAQCAATYHFQRSGS